MSGLLDAVISQASSLLPAISVGPSWLSQLRPASFRNVPFYVDVAEYTGGRRIDTKEFPKRDTSASEDIGRAARRFTLRCYVIGDDYMSRRDALEHAVEGYSTAALLVHPYRGSINCRAGNLRQRENRVEGGWCTFDIDFVADGAQPSPARSSNTASGLLSGLGSLLPLIGAGYAYATLVADNPAVLAGFAEQLLGTAASSFLGLPASTLGSLANVVSSWASTPSDTATTASAITGSFDAAATNVTAGALAPADDTDAVTGVLLVDAVADFSGGLAALATYGDTVPPIAALSAFYGGPELQNGAPVLPAGVPAGYTGYTGPVEPAFVPPGVTLLAQQEAVTQQAIIDMIEGSATYALLAVAAQYDFTVADDADAVLAQVVALLDRRIWAAACAEAPDLYRAWSSIAGLAITDLSSRAQALPRRTSYTVPRPLPATLLGQRLYADASRQDELVTLNAWPHPFFMPATGIRLSA